MFQPGDYAVCSGHGVARVVAIEEQELGGAKVYFYRLKILANSMTVMLPTSSGGIRPLVSEDEIDEVYELLTARGTETDRSTWNRRYREYMLKIKSGAIKEIAEVLRSLAILRYNKVLSFGEKKMFDQCKELLSEEIALRKKSDKKQIAVKIDSCFL